ncbi:MAG TPA: CDP-alcohol phosphatidyltransferase family protein, partial [Leptospiraceae bacterium]|nr:CDP-alcohol phosphatidyltransferase family protein [Leptospiraceae bacterium]
MFIICLFQKKAVYYYSALGLFIAASITDYFDGYLARKWDQTTEFGKFLDPLADKILIQGALVSFLFLDSQIEIWMVASIVLRDILITALRSVGIANGTEVKTFVLAKWKTAFQ